MIIGVVNTHIEATIRLPVRADGRELEMEGVLDMHCTIAGNTAPIGTIMGPSGTTDLTDANDAASPHRMRPADGRESAARRWRPRSTAARTWAGAVPPK